MLEKRWKLLPSDPAIEAALQASLGIAPVFCRLLAQRGISSFDEAKAFFRPSVNQLHDPFLMRDMEAAVDRLELAIARNERILLYGDYDVDGTSCVAMMWSFLKNFTPNLDAYLPDRQKEGYGVSPQSIDYAQRRGCTLVVAMDCGIKAHAAIERAASLGIEFIVCDHHLPEGDIPRAVAVLDPKRPDCGYPFDELCGCGVAFKLAQAFCQKRGLGFEKLEPLLDLLAVATACDIVPVLGENRVIAQLGLARLNASPRPGLKALIQKSNRSTPLTISDLVYGVGPLINAAGRLGDARDAVKTLLAPDQKTAVERADFLEKQNRRRREIDAEMAEEARRFLQSTEGWESRKSIVLFQKNWHKGIIGIAASRLAEDFHRPTIIFTESEGRAVGSARSAGGFDLYEALKKCEAEMISFGGHAFAAGMQVRLDMVERFAEKFEEVVAEGFRSGMAEPVVEVCAELDFKQITPQFWKILREFAPFGPGNRNPVFWSKNVADTGSSRDLGRGHLRLSLRQGDTRFNAVGFGLAAKLETLKNGQPLDVCYNIREEVWQGDASLQLQVKDFRQMEA